MLNNCRISHYKIKKIVKYFAADFTATETSKQLKLNRNTINRYYYILRKICLALVIDMLSTCPDNKKYIGYMKGEYGPQDYLNVYEIKEKTFFFIKSSSKPSNKDRAIRNIEFNKFLSFLYTRFSKFHGLKGTGYYYQLYETSLRYNYAEEDLFSLLWLQLRKTTKEADPKNATFTEL